MTPSVRKERLQSVRYAMKIFRLKRIVAGRCAIAEQVELTGEIRTWRNINILPHQLSPPLPQVGERQGIGPACCAPLVGTRQHVHAMA